MSEFYKDVRDRKALVPSARKKRNGSRSKKCMLPSDNLSKGELKKMNGEVVTINLNQPYSYKELVKFPIDLQKEYVQRLKDKYCMSSGMFAKMAGCAKRTAQEYFSKELGYSLSKAGKRATDEQREAFRKFANIVKEEKNDEIKEVNDEVKAVEVEPVATAAIESVWTPPMVAKLAYEGRVRDICEALISALGAASVGRFEIAFRRNNDA